MPFLLPVANLLMVLLCAYVVAIDEPEESRTSHDKDNPLQKQIDALKHCNAKVRCI